ncbi:hypothetical protein [Thermococcus sp.]
MLTQKAVKWYTKNLFPHPATEILLGLMILGTWYSLKDAQKLGFYEFMIIVEAVLLPVYGILVAAHVFRSQRVTLFEITLFNGPKNIFLGRLTSALFGLIVGIFSVALITSNQGYSRLVVSVLLKIPTYLAVMMILMVWLDSIGGIISFYILTSAVPMGLFVLLTKPYPPNTAISLLAYFLAPIGATVNARKLSLSVSAGYTVALVLSALIMLVSYISFKKKDFEPQ